MAGARVHDHVERVQAAEIGEDRRARDGIADAANAADDVEGYERELALSGELLVGVVFFAHLFRGPSAVDDERRAGHVGGRR